MISQPKSIVETDDYQILKDISYYNEQDAAADAYITERCQLDMLLPKDKTDFATIVWLHGGGLTEGCKDIPEQFMQLGHAIVSAEYRFSPKATCHQCIEDAAAAVAWTFKNIASYGGDTGKIFIAGHSAGGYLASMVTMDKSWLAAHEIDANTLAGLISFSSQVITHFISRGENSIDPLQPVIDKYAPLYHVRKDAAPVLWLTGDRNLEVKGRHEENAYMQRMLLLHEHPDTTLYEFQGYGHDMIFAGVPIMAEWINKHLGQ